MADEVIIDDFSDDSDDSDEDILMAYDYISASIKHIVYKCSFKVSDVVSNAMDLEFRQWVYVHYTFKLYPVSSDTNNKLIGFPIWLEHINVEQFISTIYGTIFQVTANTPPKVFDNNLFPNRNFATRMILLPESIDWDLVARVGFNWYNSVPQKQWQVVPFNEAHALSIKTIGRAVRAHWKKFFVIMIQTSRCHRPFEALSQYYINSMVPTLKSKKRYDEFIDVYNAARQYD